MGLEEKVEEWSMFGRNPQHTAYVNVELNPTKMHLKYLRDLLPYKDGTGFLVFKDNDVQRINGFPPSFASSDNIEVSVFRDSITATDIRNKKVLWEHSTRNRGYFSGYIPTCGEPLGRDNPVISEGKVYLAVHGCGLLALDLNNGKEEWRFIAEKKHRERGGYTSPTPAVAKDKVFVGSLETGTWSQSLNYWLHCLDANTGKENWRYETIGYCGTAQPIVTNNVVILGADDLYFIDIKRGKRKQIRSFRAPRSSRHVNSVIMVGKKIYFDTNDNRLYVVE